MTGDLDAVSRAVDGYLRQLAAEVPGLSGGEGRAVLGPVAGRSREEDEEIELDRYSEDLLEHWLARFGADVEIHSEHSRRRVGGAGPAPLLITCDPFDGSGHFMRGLPAEWWSVLTVWRAGGGEPVPVMAGAVDINRGELYSASGSSATVESLHHGWTTEVRPSRARALSDESIIAAYLMSPGYVRQWTGRSGRMLALLESEHPRARLWTDGGACSYPWLARGLIQAYVMYGEPRTEIDPGLGFAAACSLGVFSVSEDGRLTDYRFEPGRSAERVPWLIAACTPELAAQIAGIIVGA